MLDLHDPIAFPRRIGGQVVRHSHAVLVLYQHGHVVLDRYKSCHMTGYLSVRFFFLWVGLDRNAFTLLTDAGGKDVLVPLIIVILFVVDVQFLHDRVGVDMEGERIPLGSLGP